MSIEDAKINIGQPFKLSAFTSGLLGKFDTIRVVGNDGTIQGDFLQAHCEDCRLREDQPAHLKKQSA